MLHSPFCIGSPMLKISRIIKDSVSEAFNYEDVSEKASEKWWLINVNILQTQSEHGTVKIEAFAIEVLSNIIHDHDHDSFQKVSSW